MGRIYIWGAFLGSIFLLTACGDSIPGGDPKSRAISKMHGYRVSRGVAIGKGHSFYWMQQLVSGWVKDDNKTFPAKVTILKNVRGCNFTPPRKGDAVSNVYITFPTTGSTIRRATAKGVAKKAKKWVELYQKDRKDLLDYDGFSRIGDAMGIIDVVVTDTSKPQYLVLFSQLGVIWNIHAADGVKIAHIALVQAKSHGIANVPEGTIVESIPDKKSASCKFPGPSAVPQDHWNVVGNEVYLHKTKNTEVIRSLIKYHKRFSRWHSRVFGLSAEKIIYASAASHVLVGPVPSPENRVKYRPIKGATIAVSRSQILQALSDEDWLKYSRDRIKKHIKTKFHLSIENLKEN